MPKMKMTGEGVKALAKKPHPTQTDYRDTNVPGLCLRIGPRGAKWNYLRRIDGTLIRLTLGSYGTGPGEFDYAGAKLAIGDMEAGIEHGKHPQAELARERAEKREARDIDHARLFAKVAEKWAEHHKPNVSAGTWKDYQRELDYLTAKFGGDDIGTITRAQLVLHLDDVQARVRPGRKTTTGLAANVAAVVIRKLFAYAVERYKLEHDVAAGIKNRIKPSDVARDRTLDRDELRVLWRACELAGYPYGHAIRFAICMGQRVGEIGQVRRNQVKDGYWRQTKNKTRKRIDLHVGEHAQAILDDCPSFGATSFYFSAQGGKTGLRNDIWNKAIPRHIEPKLAEAAEELGLSMDDERWRMHDLRRTMRSGLTGWTNTTPDVAERTLNHAIGGVRGVYDHADYKPHVAGALHRWDIELTAIRQGEAPTHDPLAEAKAETAARRRAKVVPIRRTAK